MILCNVHTGGVLTLIVETPDHASDGENCETPEENEELHQQSNKEIRITVKDEEEGSVNGKETPTLMEHFVTQIKLEMHKSG